MKPGIFMLALMMTSMIAVATPVSAHTCFAGIPDQCGPCSDGEVHYHAPVNEPYNYWCVSIFVPQSVDALPASSDVNQSPWLTALGFFLMTLF